MSYREEFPDFHPNTMPPIPDVWEDVSWSNDACPCFSTETSRGGHFLVFVDYEDPQLRENPDLKRFSVHSTNSDGEVNFTLMDTDSWDSVLQFLSAG